MKNLMTACVLALVMVFCAGCAVPNMKPASMPNEKLVEPGPVILESEAANANRIVTFTVVGKGVEPEAALTKGQAVIMAERAAVGDGYRQFVEKLRGVYVDAYSKMGYGSVDEDHMRTLTQAMLRGVEVKEITHGQYGIASAVMALRIKFTHTGMVWWPSGLGKDVKYVEEAMPEPPPAPHPGNFPQP